MKRFSFLILVTVIPGVLACQRIDSSDVRTSGVQPIIEVLASGNGKTSVSTTLRLGDVTSSGFLDLSDGDELKIKSGDEEFAMTRQVSLINQVYYTAELNGDEEDKAIEVAFNRAEGDGAPSSKVTLPAPFTITAPAANLELIGSTDDLTIAWENSGKSDQLSLSVSGSCISIHREVLEDDGEHVVPAGTIVLSEEGTASGCDIRVTLERLREGTLDPAFDPEGTVQAMVQHKVSLSFVP